MRISAGVQTCALPIYDRPEAGVRLHARIAVVAIDRGLALVEFRIDTSLRVLVHLRDGVFPALRVDADLGAERVDAVGAVVDLVERSEERRVGKACVSKCRSRW